MKVEIKVPPMGESITEATIGEIIKSSGEQVSMDEEVLELETDKVNQVLYAPAAGVLNFSVKPDQVVKIGDVIGFVDSEGEIKAAPEPKTEAPIAEAPKEPVQAKAEPKIDGEARISKESYLKEILTEEKAPAPQVQAKVPEGRETRKKMTKLRKVIGERLVESQRTTAMLTTFNEVDMTEVMKLRAKYKESFQREHGAKLGFMSFFMKAAVNALKEFPEFNSYIEGDEMVHREYYNVGIAVGTERGLFVPVIRDCDELGFAEIESEIARYAQKAREGKLAVDDLQGGGFTITNGGTYGSLLSTPILNPPQCGILGMHKIEKRPVVVDDEIVIRPMMYLALSYDHRIVDGKGAVSFLVHIKNSLEDPSRMLLGV